MKKVLTLLLLVTLLTSCKTEQERKQEQELQNPTTYNQVYKIGEVLYLKPDSLKAVVQDFDETDGTYQMFWREGEDYPHIWVSESMIYGTVPDEITTLTDTITETYE